MKQQITRIINSIKIAWWSYNHPNVFNMPALKMCAGLLDLIFKVAAEDKNMMTHIGFIHPDTKEDHQIVSLWAGAGIAASPNERIRELLEENRILKMKLAQSIKEV